MKPLLIINGTLVTAEKSTREDIALAEGKIISIGQLTPASLPGYEVIDATGKLVFPGAIDPHVHMALPTPAGNSCDDFISGSRAAVAGGTTSIIDFVTPLRGQSLLEALDQRREEAKDSRCNCTLHMGISEWNPQVASEVKQCIRNEGITSFKAYLAYRDTIGIGIEQLREVMEVVGSEGGILMVHCEDGELISFLQMGFLYERKTGPAYHHLSRPPEAEISAIREVTGLSELTGCPVYIVHTSTAGGADLILQAKEKGLKVFGETCPQYLLLNDSDYNEKYSAEQILPYVISPPLRKKEDYDRLWRGLADRTFDVVATDHCPFNLNGQKDRGKNDFTKIPNGAGGIEHRLPLLYSYGVLTKRISVNRFIELVSTSPAEIFGWGNKKGKLMPGYDADIAIWDPDYEGTISVKNHLSKCDSEIYEGFQTQGRPELVIIGGRTYLPMTKYE